MLYISTYCTSLKNVQYLYCKKVALKVKGEAYISMQCINQVKMYFKTKENFKIVAIKNNISVALLAVVFCF